ncbi:MAG TPA: NifU family protein [Flavobacteriales bacterium]|nr:NifU family protein [Flavobacteriales bacterium]
MSSDLNTRVNEAINEIRPFLIADGGDIELVEITADKVARVKLLGACKSCSMSSMTIKAGVEESIRKAAPEISGVESVVETVTA